MNTIMKKHKQFLLLCAAFCMILFLTGCDSMEDRVNISKWQAQASKNALSYLEEKYEFQAKVKKCKCARATGLFATSPYSFQSVLLKKKTLSSSNSSFS